MNQSIGPNLKYIQKIEEQEKLIEFLKSKYKEQTGYEAPIDQEQQQQSTINNKSIIMPSAKSLIFGKHEEESKQQEEYNNFYDAIAALQLPQRAPPTKQLGKQKLKTTLNLKNPLHLVEVIKLNNFQTKNFNRLALRDFLECLQDMKTLHTLELRYNGIDDSYVDELKFIITNTSIQNLDISHNEIGVKGIDPFFNTLKGVNYFKSLNVTRNNFCSNSPDPLTYDLYHIACDAYKQGQAEYKGSDTICKFISSQRSLRNVQIQDSHIHDIKPITQTLSSNTSFLTELTLKFCYLSADHIKNLSLALQNNNSLVYLNIQQNAINDLSGQYIATMLTTNHYLYHIDLEHNQLGDHFIEALSHALKKNNVLNAIRLGWNVIKNVQPLLQVIGPDNNTVKDLGTLEQNPITLLQVDQLQKRVQNKQSSNFSVLKPISFTQSLHKTQDSFRLWNI
ncbi:hypothetical protein pb186bvf_019709 [Paramecium bursaria]